ncbi:MAG: hypothetical protein M1820_005523 [Bogoriella megaspora]|nr:MAG: hypothetical protein M1820_005523 [Bogoriella megaspora]
MQFTTASIITAVLAASTTVTALPSSQSSQSSNLAKRIPEHQADCKWKEAPHLNYQFNVYVGEPQPSDEDCHGKIKPGLMEAQPASCSGAGNNCTLWGLICQPSGGDGFTNLAWTNTKNEEVPGAMASALAKLYPDVSGGFDCVEDTDDEDNTGTSPDATSSSTVDASSSTSYSATFSESTDTE